MSAAHVETLFQKLLCHTQPPACFPSPFDIQPHQLAVAAADCLQRRLPELCGGIHNFGKSDGGKMLGVLVVKAVDGSMGYLSAFSGMLGQRWHCDGFVPPVFDLAARDRFLCQGESRLALLSAQISRIENSSGYTRALKDLASVRSDAAAVLGACREENKQRQISRDALRFKTPDDLLLEQTLASQSREDKRHYRQLKKHWRHKEVKVKSCVSNFSEKLDTLYRERRSLSGSLQSKVFDGYQIRSFEGQSVLLASLFNGRQPSGGTGDCAAVKLLNYCHLAQLTPLCLAEFWWGSSASGGIRTHGKFYPACRGKCAPVLPFMLKGVTTARAAWESVVQFSDTEPAIVFEDDHLVIVNKPCGMLSVPGKLWADSVEMRLRARYPQADNASVLVHRLDQATSGLMLGAKNAQAHKILQKQFLQRQVGKKYCAVLSGELKQLTGSIDLPLRVDIDDRPRQLVCHEHGKRAITHYKVLHASAGKTRVEFEPVTGRTHQLRVHAAHPQGLNNAIVGDELYGNCASRLHLHAEYLSFIHPVSNTRVEFTEPVPF